MNSVAFSANRISVALTGVGDTALDPITVRRAQLPEPGPERARRPHVSIGRVPAVVLAQRRRRPKPPWRAAAGLVHASK